MRPNLNGMQNAVGPEGFDGLFEGEAAMEAKPFAGVAMPLNIKAVGADPVEVGEGRTELLAEMVREAGALARRSRGPCPIRGDRPPGWHDRDRGFCYQLACWASGPFISFWLTAIAPAAQISCNPIWATPNQSSSSS